MVNCEQHDYLEIACTFTLAISLTLDNSHVVTGIASDILYNQNKEHCISLKQDQKQILLALNTIKSMTAITVNPHFTTVNFD
ncbi:MAG: Rho-binding antiterminator [Cellvibrionaceae bacterium]